MDDVDEAAGRQRSAVSLYVTAFAVTAAASFAWVSYRDGVSLSWSLLVFAILAAVAEGDVVVVVAAHLAEELHALR